MPALFCLLALLLAPLPATADAPRLTISVETDGTAPSPDAPACDVTVEGRHGGVSGEITFDMSESQVRTRVGWWASLARGGDQAFLTLRPGDSFSQAFDLRLGCNAHRRYRFVFTHEGTTHTHVYPSEDDFTQEQVIDLGAVSRFFGIAAAPDAEPQPVALGTLDLEGEWVRSESNNDPNDGMRITVEGDEAVMTYVPPTASSVWRVGDTLWREIEADGALRVLGSDGNYYPAELTAAGDNQLTLAIRHGGAGNDQTWVRSGGCWTDAHVAAYGTRAPNIALRFSTALPSGLQNALRAARDAEAFIQTVALTPSDEWVVVAANQPCYSAGFPSDVREWIDQYIASGREIDVVAFGPGGRWLVVAEDYLRRTTNVSDAIMEEIRRAQGQGRRLTSFAFSDDPDDGWMFTAGGVVYRGDGADADLWAAKAAAETGRRPVHEIAIAPGGAWVLVAEDWYATDGAPASLLEWMERYRTDSERRLDHVVLHSMDGTLRWIIVSNAPEPAPDPSDLINLVEHGLPGDSSIYQRMKRHRITGLSVAVIQNNEVAWVRSYGLRQFDLPESYVYPNTLFDAASISKPVSYAAALQLVDAGDLNLTQTNVLTDLAGDELPSGSALRAIRPGRIHLAHLLSHCAGLDHASGSSGAQAIAPGNPLPTLAQMFLGQSPASANRRVVPIDTVDVGEMVDYSGANSLLVQALMEDAADGGYDGQMERLLNMLGMRNSTFRTDFASTMSRERFAYGHDLDGAGNIVRREVRIYPNQTAAGLRTTAPDLAQYVIMLNQDGEHRGLRILDSTTVDRFIGRDGVGIAEGVREAACLSTSSMQLGIRAMNQGMSNERFWHGGLHNGYRTYMSGLPQQGGGVVILITGQEDDADALRDEIRAAVRNAYGWTTTSL